MTPSNSTRAESNPVSVPAGDLPPQPRWPLVLSATLWGLWIVFLFVMMWMRIRTTPV